MTPRALRISPLGALSKVEEILEDLCGKGGGKSCWVGRSKAERTRWPQTPPSSRLQPRTRQGFSLSLLLMRGGPQTILSKRRDLAWVHETQSMRTRGEKEAGDDEREREGT